MYNFRSDPLNFTPVEQFINHSRKIYELACNNMDSRQEETATYHDKILGDRLWSMNDKVYIFLARNKRWKLFPKLYGPFEIVHADHLVYNVKIESCQGKIKQILSRDRLKNVKNPNAQTITPR